MAPCLYPTSSFIMDAGRSLGGRMGGDSRREIITQSLFYHSRDVPSREGLSFSPLSLPVISDHPEDQKFLKQELLQLLLLLSCHAVERMKPLSFAHIYRRRQVLHGSGTWRAKGGTG